MVTAIPTYLTRQLNYIGPDNQSPDRSQGDCAYAIFLIVSTRARAALSHSISMSH